MKIRPVVFLIVALALVIVLALEVGEMHRDREMLDRATEKMMERLK